MKDKNIKRSTNRNDRSKWKWVKTFGIMKIVKISLFLGYSYGFFHLRKQNNQSQQKYTSSNLKLPTRDESMKKRNEKNSKEVESTKRIENDSNFLPRVLAFYFPQFHRDSINDYLWGDNFTDWDNLKKAPERNRLNFTIPRPTELGYYDLTDVTPRKKQGELAKMYDVDGFLYHHYWFYDENHPGPNLHTPLVNMLNDGHPDVPFAFHWCASKWTNTWSGNVRDDFVYPQPNVLQVQNFPTDPNDPRILEHYQFLKPFFHHRNYIRVDGMPLFMMYQRKPGALPVLRKLKQLAMEDGFKGLYFTVGLSKPHGHLLPIEDEEMNNRFHGAYQRTLGFPIYEKVLSYPNPEEWAEGRSLEVPSWCINKDESSPIMRRLKDIPGIISSFDNTPRRNYTSAHLFASSGTPDEIIKRFQKSLYSALYYESCCFTDEKIRLQKKRIDDDRFIVINAWNEWAEGMVLEPSNVYETKFLKAIRDTKQIIRESGCSISK